MIEALAVLIGEWDVESNKLGVRGRATVDRFEGDRFVRLRSGGDDGEMPSSTWIIGSDDSTDHCTSLYYDSRNVRRVYQMRVRDGVWTIWRDAPNFNQRYIGKIVDGGKTIAGQWEFSEDGKSWEVDFDLTYRKVQ
jgi:hypothetical protein